MRDLNILIATPDAERFRGALMLAAAQAALGGKATLFLQLDAVTLLRRPMQAPRDARHQANGLPSLAALLDEALALGVTLIACQSGLSLYGLAAKDLPEGIAVGGPIAFLQQADDEARLLFA
jgi:predicted peroxiredoxin